MANTIEGMQAAGVQACAKHFSKDGTILQYIQGNHILTMDTVGNEQELNRDSISSNIDSRTTHEVPMLQC
ncbi:hypothetical protein DH86_00000362 [Scytalidium sp. 3C]|nr:hypothetical protein DH86_00000362 [Scytalidium sp. 3C]